MARYQNRKNTPANSAPINDSQDEVTEMLDNSYDVENGTDVNDEFADFTNEPVIETPDESEVNAAFEDAARDAEGTDLADDNAESAGENDSDEKPAEAEKPKAVPLTEDIVEIVQFGAQLYADSKLDDQAKMMGQALVPGSILPIHMARNSILDIVDALNKAHFSEAHDDVITRAEQEAEKYDLVKVRLEKVKELKAEFEKAMENLSTELKSVLGIKPLSDEDRKAYAEDAKAKLMQIDTQVKSLVHTNESNVTRFLTPVIEYVNALPALPVVSAKGTTTVKIGAKSSSAGEVIRARLGYENGGGVAIDDESWDKRHSSFTDAIRSLKDKLEWAELKSNDITKMWLDAAGESDWRKVEQGAAVEFTITNPENNKSAKLKVIREIA